MADIVQWSITTFWAQLQALENQIHAVELQLNADKSELQTAYSKTRMDPDQARAAANQALLNQQIHRNSDLRVTYLLPVKNKFNQAVSLASKMLKSGGYTTPTLTGHPTGLGVVVAIAPAAAVTLIGVALAAIVIVDRMTKAQRDRTHALVGSLSLAKSADDVQKILDASAREYAADGKAHPPLGLDLGALAPVLGLVALLVFAPTIMRFLPSGPRKAAA